MKIAFWSNARGKCSTSSNLACIGVMNAILYGKESVIFENHINLSGISNYLEKKDTMGLLREKNLYFNNIGMESLLKKIYTINKDKHIGRGYALSYADKHLYYIPTSGIVNSEVYTYELNNCVVDMMDRLEREFGCVMADASGDNNISTKVILEQADKIVVNLTQDKNIIDNFFENFSSIIHKCVFIVSNYEPSGQIRDDYLVKKHGVRREKVGIIPYSFELRDALLQGKLVEYISRNIACKRRDINFYLINELKRTCALVMEDRNV